MQNKKLIVIGGPTASGKTSLAIQIAKHFNTQILSADSRQCYNELNIGVAKPSNEELQEVPHHFINSHSIQDEVTAGEYERFGLKALQTIFSESDYAVCVGGTGLYIKALCHGLDDIPPINKDIKIQLEQAYEKNGLEWLQTELKKVDEPFLVQADEHNHMRLLRALIFYESNGASILNYLGKKKEDRNFETDFYSINMSRENLYERINHRVDVMMQTGLLDEVKHLEKYKHIKALQTVGYKEIFNHFAGDWTLEKSIEKVKQHSRNYAKRQITWFKNQGDFRIETPETILQEVAK